MNTALTMQISSKMMKQVFALCAGLALLVRNSFAITTNFSAADGYARGSPTQHPIWAGDGNSFDVDPVAGEMRIDDNASRRYIFYKSGLAPGKNMYTVGVGFRFKRETLYSFGREDRNCILIRLKNHESVNLSLKRQASNPSLYKLQFWENTKVTFMSSDPIDEKELGFSNISDLSSDEIWMELDLKRNFDGTSTATCTIRNVNKDSVVESMKANFNVNTTFYSNRLYPLISAAESKATTQVFEKTVLSFTASAKRTVHKSTRPNLIVILMDDISSQELGCYGNKRGNTPNIDKLVKDGLKFQNAWATTTCTSTRALLMSGTYADKSGIYDNSVKVYKPTIPEKRKALPKSLQEIGYSTFYVGKWHLPGEPQDPEWGFDKYVAYGSLGPRYPPEWNDLYKGWWWYWWTPSQISETYKLFHSPSATWLPFIIENGEFRPTTEEDFGPTLICDEVINFADKNKPTGKPFFVHYAMHLPHEPWTEMRDDDGKKTKPGFEENIKMLDRIIGRLVDGLTDAGLYNDTLIFLAGDNPSSDIGKVASGALGVHVPYMILGGSNHISQKGTTAILTDISDIYPTFLDFAGVSPNYVGGLDGMSLKPYLTGESEETREYIFAYVGPHRVIRDLHYCYDGRWFWRCDESGDVFKFERLDMKMLNWTETDAFQRLMMKMSEHPPAPDEAIAGSKKGENWLRVRDKGGLSSWEKKTEDRLEKGLDYWLNNPGRRSYSWIHYHTRK